jgi:replicative DNA helicase
MSERIPPFSEEAERGLLGAILLDGLRIMPLALRILGPKDDVFYVPANGIIWTTLVKLADRHSGAGIDILTVTDELRRTGALEAIGGAAYLDKIIDSTPTSTHGEYYLDLVRQKYILRRTIEVCRAVGAEAFSQEQGDVFLKSIAPRFVEIVSDVSREKSNLEVMQTRVQEFHKAKEAREAGEPIRSMGLETPWMKLTSLLGGLEPGLTIVAGRPSAGKTTFESQIATHIASLGIPVARVSLDSPREELLDRDLSRKAGVSLPKAKQGYAKQNQLLAMDEAAVLLGDYPMHITTRDRDIRTICTWIRAMKMLHNVQLATVDYVRLVGAAEMGSKEHDTTARVSLVSGRLKGLSLELGIPILLLVQLNREYAKGDKEPQLSDLSDSGSLEQDASKVIFLHIDGKQKKAMEEAEPGATKHQRPVWVDVAKNKNGETAKLAFWMLPPYFRFELAGSGEGWDADYGGNDPTSASAEPSSQEQGELM